MPSANMDESRGSTPHENQRVDQIETSLAQTRQLYAAFELLRTDHLLAGLPYLTDPLLRSLCGLALVITTDTVQTVSSYRDGIEQLRRQGESHPLLQKEIKTVVENLERMSRESCDTLPSTKTFSDYAWRTLRLLRAAGKKAQRAEIPKEVLVARVKRKVALWVIVPAVVIVCGMWAHASYLKWLSSNMNPKTVQRIADMKALGEALNKFKKDHGHYPSTEGRWDGLYSSWGNSTENWIPGLVPNYINKLPQDPRNHKSPDEQYLYWSDGQDFKVIAHNVPDAGVVGTLYPDMYDKARAGRAYGTWSPSAANR